MKLQTLMIICSATLSLMFTGCGPRLPEGMPDLYPARIVLTYDDGQTISDASIALVPVSSDVPPRWSYFGITDKSGIAAMKTHAKYDGIPSGTYKVTLKKIESTGQLPPFESENPESKAKVEDWKKSDKMLKETSKIEPIFDSPSTTPLEITVEKNTNNSFELKAGKVYNKVLPTPIF